MRSPFPGMDPWLEGYWGGVHHRLITYCCDLIQVDLPPGLIAVVEETVYLIDAHVEREFRPDVSIYENSEVAGRARPADNGGVAVAEPIRVVMDPVVEAHIEVRELREDHRIVTVIEVLSPTNKVHPQGREEYLRKRERYYRAKLNVMELDLLRAGMHLVDLKLESLPPESITPYKCAVRRGGSLSGMVVDYYPLPLRERLPRIRLALRETDPDLILDLQAPVDEAYLKGRYGERIDYSKPPEPPLSAEDAQWARELIQQAGRA